MSEEYQKGQAPWVENIFTDFFQKIFTRDLFAYIVENFLKQV